MAHSETRNGQNVEGSYNYVDANGALVTVTYTAGPQGYSENREVQDGVVTMRNIPGPWTGPLAGVARSAPAALDQTALIQRVISRLQPQISSAVRAAVRG